MRIIRFLLVFVAAALPLFAQTAEQAAVDRAAEKMLAAWKVPGAAVAVVRDDKVIVLGAYGVKELGKPERVDVDTLFGLASTTKAFTTTAMAMLVDQKKLSWDDPVQKYLPYFQVADACTAPLITLRDIVSHRTGLSRHDELWDNTTLTRAEVIHAVAGAKPWKPIRAGYQYNNVMFIAAGESLAAAAQMSWDDFVRSRIFEPLGMKRTTTGSADFLATDHATGHRYTRATDSITVQPWVDDHNLGSAGAIKSSARDMAEWLRFQLGDGAKDGRRLLSADALAETRKPLTPIAVDPEASPGVHVQSYAMGWNIEDYDGALMVVHAGALNGYRTQVALFPEKHIGIVTLVNAGRGYAGVALRDTIADLLLGRPATDWNQILLAVDAKLDAKDAASHQERESKRNPDHHPTHPLSAYAGTYGNDAWGPATVSFEGDSLTLRWQRLRLPLVVYNYDTFTASSERDDIDETVTFHLADDGHIESLTLFDQEFKAGSSAASTHQP